MTREQIYKKLKEDEIYQNLLYDYRLSLEKTHEKDEIEESMQYVYPKFLKQKAKVLSYDFNPIQGNDEYDHSSNRENKFSIGIFLVKVYCIGILIVILIFAAIRMICSICK